MNARSVKKVNKRYDGSLIRAAIKRRKIIYLNCVIHFSSGIFILHFGAIKEFLSGAQSWGGGEDSSRWKDLNGFTFFFFYLIFFLYKVLSLDCS